MKHLSYWASRHASLAIALIIVCEVVNGFNGFMLGATGLGTVPVAGLHAGVAGLVSLAVGVRLLARTGVGEANVRRWCLFGAFLGNFLLFGLLGGLTAPRSLPHDVPTGAWGSRRIESRANTRVRSDTLRPVDASKTAVTNAGQSDRQGGKRTGYVLLFVLSLFLLFSSTALACNIACSGYGFLAAIVFLLGLGFLAGGIYFLGRSTDKQLKRRRDMTPAGRRRTGRRFWLSWGILTGLSAILLIIAALAGS